MDITKEKETIPPMETSKEELITNIKEWIKMDSEITELKKQTKALNSRKKELTEQLVHIMKTNEIDQFDIHGGQLKYKKTTVRKPINVKTLLTALHEFYKEDPSMAENVSKHLIESRAEEVKETICRKIILPKSG
jgi:seryl-tRNA synthetase